MMIEILKEPGKAHQIIYFGIAERLLLLKKVPVIKNMMVYSKVNNNIAMSRSAEIARLVKNIRKHFIKHKPSLAFLFNEYS